MKHLISTTGKFDDLFGKMPPSRPASRGGPLVIRRHPSELKVVDALCRQLRRKQAPQEKRWIGHLICQNLLSMLRHRPR
jgi:hypothetical protein